jgi:hypothetical protein
MTVQRGCATSVVYIHKSNDELRHISDEITWYEEDARKSVAVPTEARGAHSRQNRCLECRRFPKPSDRLVVAEYSTQMFPPRAVRSLVAVPKARAWRKSAYGSGYDQERSDETGEQGACSRASGRATDTRGRRSRIRRSGLSGPAHRIRRIARPIWARPRRAGKPDNGPWDPVPWPGKNTPNYCFNAKEKRAFPAATEMYCRPFTEYVIGPDAMIAPREVRQSGSPVLASKAKT